MLNRIGIMCMFVNIKNTLMAFQGEVLPIVVVY